MKHIIQKRVHEVVPQLNDNDKQLIMWNNNSGLLIPVKAGLKVGDVVNLYSDGPIGRPIDAIKVIEPYEGEVFPL